MQAARGHALADLATARTDLARVTAERDRALQERDQALSDFRAATDRSAQFENGLDTARREFQERQGWIDHLTHTLDLLAKQRDLVEGDLEEVTEALTNISGRIVSSQESRYPKRERSPANSPPRSPPHKSARSGSTPPPPDVPPADQPSGAETREIPGGKSETEPDPEETKGEVDTSGASTAQGQDRADAKGGAETSIDLTADSPDHDSPDYDDGDGYEDESDSTDEETRMGRLRSQAWHRRHGSLPDPTTSGSKGASGPDSPHSSPQTPPQRPTPPSGGPPVPNPPPGGPPGGGSPGGGPPGGGPPGGGPPGGAPHTPLRPPLFPPASCIPGYAHTRMFLAADEYPWDPTFVGSVAIIAMIDATLTKRLPIPPGFLYPERDPLVEPPQPVVGFRSDLITGANITALMATQPWLVMQRQPAPITFDFDLHRRASSPLWRIATSFSGLVSIHLQAYWESTHYIEISDAMCRADPVLEQYHKARRKRRIRIGHRWRLLLVTLLPLMRNLWADIDLLLDPIFLHLPTQRDRVHWYPGSASRSANRADPNLNRPEPTDLITALAECDREDPWRNHYRDHPADHPSMRTARLPNKFNPPAHPAAP